MRMNYQSFEKGRTALKSKDYRAALREFEETLQNVSEHHEQYNRVASYVGLTRVLVDDRNGLLVCRDAASSEVLEGDVFLNLACAEWYCDNRKRAVDSIIRGRKIDGENEQLVKACMLLDSRRKTIFPFLSRQHFLNRTVGRLMRRAHGEITVHKLLS